MAPSSKGPLLIRALPSTLTVPAALKNATLAELRIPLAPDLASIDLPDALLSRLKADGLPLPTPHKTKKELDNLKQSLLEWGHNAAISPPILAPTPLDLLDPDAAAAQADALARLADLDSTTPSADLLRDLQLVVLSGRARWRILEELAGELAARARARDKKTRGNEQGEQKKEEEMRDGALVTEVCVVLLHSTVFTSPLLLSHIFTTSNLVHSLAAAKFEPTIIYLITFYAATRNGDVDAMLPDLGSLTTDMYRALRSRLVTDLALEVFGKPGGPRSTLSYISPSGLGRLFGSKYSHATPIFLMGFESTVRFFNLIDVDIAVTSLVLFSALAHDNQLANPLALPPAHDLSLDEAREHVRRQGEELALALRDVMAPWESRTSTGTWAWTSVKHAVGRKVYRRNSAGEPHLPDTIKLGRSDYMALTDTLEGLIDMLEEGSWVEDVTAEDLGNVEPFILPEQIESLKPPRPPAAASAHHSEELGDYFGAEVACWIELLIAFFFNLANAVRPEDVREAKFQMASLEDAILALYSPTAAERISYQRAAWKETGPWSLSTQLVDLVRKLYTYLWLHRNALTAALLLIDKPDPFGAISAFAPNSSASDSPAPRPTAPTEGATTVWCTAPWRGVIGVLESSAERPPTIDLAEALKAVGHGALADEEKLSTLAKASEQACARGRAPAQVRRTLEALAQELLHPRPPPSPPPRTPTPESPVLSPFPPTPVTLVHATSASARQATLAAAVSAGSSAGLNACPRTPSRRASALFRALSAEEDASRAGRSAPGTQAGQDELREEQVDGPDKDEPKRMLTATSSPSPPAAPTSSAAAPSSSSQLAASSSFFDRSTCFTSTATSSPPALDDVSNAKRPFRRTTSSSSSTSVNALAPSVKRIRPSVALVRRSSSASCPDLNQPDADLSDVEIEPVTDEHDPRLEDSSESDDGAADGDYTPDDELRESNDEDKEVKMLLVGEDDGEEEEEEEQEGEEETFGPDIRDRFEALDHATLCHARQRAIAGWHARSTIADLLLLHLHHFIRQPQLPLVSLPDPLAAASPSALPSLAPLARDMVDLERLVRWPFGRREIVGRFFRSSRPLGIDDYLNFEHSVRPDVAEPLLLELNITLWEISTTDKNGSPEALEWQDGLTRLGRELSARGGRPSCVSGTWSETSAAGMAVQGWDGHLSERGRRREVRRAKDEKKRRE